ncbi:hypothetical protein B0H21DRAFT_719314 [Amylocystis lapponica]|nr:hypothetical protein B0H21DRAFT_719314 [Amylocystis lapponica]
MPSQKRTKLHTEESPKDGGESVPPTSPSPGLSESNDSKTSLKREREVSLEPATPKATTIDTDSERADHKDRRTPAKKNRLSGALDAPQEAEEDPAPSCSPPHESKIRQISQGVEDLTWQNMKKENGAHDDAGHTDEIDEEAGLPSSAAPEVLALGENPPLIVDNAGEDEHRGEADPAEQPADAAEEHPTDEALDEQSVDADVEDISSASNSSGSDVVSAASSRPTSVVFPHSRRGSDSDLDQEKGLKRKLGDRSLSEAFVPEVVNKRNSVPETGATKRQRDEPDEDVNPRETKRPTPPPDEEAKTEAKTAEASGSSAPDTKKRSVDKSSTSTPKMGGFMAYASTTSPFANITGPSIFGSKSSSPSPWASTSTSTSGLSTPSVTSSPFTGSITPSPAKESTTEPQPSQTPLKRTGFEAFASTSSPFASVKRSKSPPLGGGFGTLARSRSPSRTPARATNAFSAYAAGGAQGFATPTSRKGESALGVTPVFGAAGSRAGLGILNGDRKKEPEEEGSKERAGASSHGVSFGERLRAQKDEEEGSDEDQRVALTEQEVHTGEEDEEIRYQVRGKLYVLTSQNQWKEKGTGTLKLNVRREDGGGARLVMRKEAVYTVLLNAALFKGMRCVLAQDPRYLRFSVFEEGVATHYNLRLSTAKIAEELLDEITSHIPSA